MLAQQAGHGLTPIQAGLIMLATPVAAIAAFPLVQALAQRDAAVRQLGSSLGVALLGLLFSGVVGRTSGALAEQPVQTMAGHRATGDPSVVAQAADALAGGVALAGLGARGRGRGRLRLTRRLEQGGHVLALPGDDAGPAALLPGDHALASVVAEDRGAEAG